MFNIYSLDRFERQCEYYKSLLDFVVKHCHSVRNDIDYNKYLILENPVYSFVNDIMLGTVFIGKFEENSGHSDKINQCLDEIESFKNIEIIDSNCDKKYQFRNCLAHADFRFCLNENEEYIPTLVNSGYFVPKFKNNPMYLEIDNGKIKGKISWPDFWLIMGKYMDLANLEQQSKQMYMFPQNLCIKNNMQLEKFINNISILKLCLSTNLNLNDDSFKEKLEYLLKNFTFASKQDIEQFKQIIYDNARLYGKNDINLESKGISEAEKKLVFNYIKYLGLGTWERSLNENQRRELLRDLMSLKCGEYCNMFSAISFSNIHSIFGQKFSNKELADKVGHLFMEGPFLYADFSVGYANYLLGYVRQVEKDGEILPLKYKNINLTGINPTFLNPKEKKSVIKKDEEESFTEIIQLNTEEELLYQTVGNIVTKIGYMNKENKDPKKEERVKALNESLEKINVEDVINAISKRIISEKLINDMSENEIVQKIKGLLKEHEPLNEKEKEILEVFKKLINKYKNKGNQEYPIGDLSSKWQKINESIIRYEDSSNLFRHLRNSIEHGRFYIDYNPALTKKDFSKAYICFYDKDSKESTENNFTLKITLGRFNKLLEDFAMCVKPQIQETHIDKTDEYTDLFKSVHLYGMELSDLILDISAVPIEQRMEVINKKIANLIREQQKQLEKKLRPTGEDFEAVCDEQILSNACNSSIGNELKNELELEQR